MNRYYIGIDPGATGAAAIISEGGLILKLLRFDKMTPREIAEALEDFVGGGVAAIEKVGAMPKQGVSSTFKFGWNAGWWDGVLAGLGIPLREHPTPATWQRAMGCLTKGDKNVSKARAHEFWPERAKELTHATCDAALIGEWLRRTNPFNAVALERTESATAGPLAS